VSPSAKVIADSISPEGVRLTTLQVTFHRFVLAEMNTHRVFSRNSASSRAIPLAKQLKRVVDDPTLPVVWAREQKGMQGGDEVEDTEEAQRQWWKARRSARGAAEELGKLGVHKSIANRLLEPFMWHTAVITSTAFQNFFAQRCHEAAQPEIRVAAEMMQAAYEESNPAEVGEGEWHLPYVGDDEETLDALAGKTDAPAPWDLAAKVSAARCARVSYLTQDGRRDPQEDLNLYDRLTVRQKDAIAAHNPIHWSPLEHVATPWSANRQESPLIFETGEGLNTYRHVVETSHLPRVGNLLGWRSLRTEEEARQGEKTYR
jgi:thymidylate synthase ThyX